MAIDKIIVFYFTGIKAMKQYEDRLRAREKMKQLDENLKEK